MMKYHGIISFTMNKNHPDIKYVEDWTKDKVFMFDDEYAFDKDYPMENVNAYIKHDLMLVAGGGYNTEHIDNVKFEIKRV